MNRKVRLRAGKGLRVGSLDSAIAAALSPHVPHLTEGRKNLRPEKELPRKENMEKPSVVTKEEIDF